MIQMNLPHYKKKTFKSNSSVRNRTLKLSSYNHLYNVEVRHKGNVICLPLSWRHQNVVQLETGRDAGANNAVDAVTTANTKAKFISPLKC